MHGPFSEGFLPRKIPKYFIVLDKSAAFLTAEIGQNILKKYLFRVDTEPSAQCLKVYFLENKL